MKSIISVLALVFAITSINLSADGIVWEKPGCPGYAPLHFDSDKGLALFRSHRFLSSTKNEYLIRVLDIKTSSYLFENSKETKVYTAKILCSGTQIGILYDIDSSCYFDLFDIYSGSLIRRDELGKYIPVNYQITENYIYTFDLENKLRAWDIVLGEERLFINDAHEGAIGISEVNSKYVGIAWTDEFQLWDIEKKEKIRAFSLYNPVHTKMCYLSEDMDTLYLMTRYYNPTHYFDVEKFDAISGRYMGLFTVPYSNGAGIYTQYKGNLVFARNEVSPNLFTEIVYVDMETEQAIRHINIGVRQFNVSDSGEQLFLRNDDYGIFDVLNNTMTYLFPCVELSATAFNNDYNSIVLTTKEQSKILDRAKGDLLKDLDYPVFENALLSNNRYYYKSRDSLIFRSLETNKLLEYFDLKEFAHYNALVNYDAEYCLFKKDTNSILYSLDKLEIIDTINLTNGLFTPNGKFFFGYFYGSDWYKRVFKIVETSSGDMKFEYRLKEILFLSACSPDSKYAYLILENEGLKRVSFETFEMEDIPGELKNIIEPYAMRFRVTDNGYIVESINGNAINIRDSRNGEIIKTYERYVDSYAFNVSHDTRFMIVSYYDGTLVLYELPEEMWTNTIVESDENAKFSVQPNPANSTITIISPEVSIANLRIFDALGRIHFIKEHFNLRETIPVDGFAPGLYYVNISTNGKSVSKKVLIVK